MSDSPELYGFKAVSNHGTFDTFPFLGHEGRFPIALWHDWLQSPAVTDAFDLPTPIGSAVWALSPVGGTFNSETQALPSGVKGGSWFELALAKVSQ